MNPIEAEHLSIHFGSKIILKDFSFAIRAGELVGILGPNGAGKSTLLKLILGLVLPASGALKVMGDTPHQGHPHIGYMPQTRFVPATFDFTGYQFLASALHAHRFGLPLLSKQDKAQLENVLTQVGGEEIAHRSFLELSGGERQRLLLAQALLSDPKILLLDEPLNNLDPHYQESLIELISKIVKTSNIAVLLTAHDVNALLPVMDRVLYLVNGEAKLGLVDEVITSHNLSLLYGMPIEVLNYKGRVFVLGQNRAIGDFHQHCHE